MGTLAKSADPDEILHYAPFHQGLHCLLRLKKKIFREGNISIWKSLPVTPLKVQCTAQVHFIVSDGRINPYTKG